VKQKINEKIKLGRRSTTSDDEKEQRAEKKGYNG
jgi:hypothetical protein